MYVSVVILDESRSTVILTQIASNMNPNKAFGINELLKLFINHLQTYHTTENAHA